MRAATRSPRRYTAVPSRQQGRVDREGQVGDAGRRRPRCRSRRAPRGRPPPVDRVRGHIPRWRRTWRSGSRLRTTMATAQAIAAPRMPYSGISTTLSPTLTARATVLLRRLSQLRPAISSTESTGPHSRREQHGQRQDDHHVGGDLVALAEDAHQGGARTLRSPGRAARRRSCSRAWRPGRPSWRPGLAPREQRAELRGERLLDRLDEQLSEHDEPGGRGVERGVGRRRQRRHQHDVGALQRGLGDPRDRPGRGVGPELAGQRSPRRDRPPDRGCAPAAPGATRRPPRDQARRAATRPGRARARPRRRGTPPGRRGPGPRAGRCSRPRPSAAWSPRPRVAASTSS